MLDLFTDPKTVWFIVGLIFLAAEFAIPGVTLVFFGIGALITAGCLYLLPLHFALQIGIFLVSSMAGLLLFRAKIKARLFSPGISFRNAPDTLQPEFVGVVVDVIEDITPPHPGRVLLHGTSWQANAAGAVNKGARVRITDRDGLVVIVEEVQ